MQEQCYLYLVAEKNTIVNAYEDSLKVICRC